MDGRSVPWGTPEQERVRDPGFDYAREDGIFHVLWADSRLLILTIFSPIVQGLVVTQLWETLVEKWGENPGALSFCGLGITIKKMDLVLSADEQIN